MRREIRGGRLLFLAAAAAASLFYSTFVKAQVLPSRIETLIENLSEQGMDTEELAIHFNELMRRGSSINELDRRELEETLLLSPFQIESLLEYRKEFGDILSEEELSLVDGFSGETASLCSVFFTYSSLLALGERPPANLHSHNASFRSKVEYGEKELPLRFKYNYRYDRKYEAGITIDNDAGEKFPDFVSAHAAYDGGGVVKSLNVGDYVPRFGQGLVVWKSFGMTPFGEPSSLLRNQNGIRSYKSSSENNFFRGAAITVGPHSGRERDSSDVSDRGGRLSIFVSYHPVDARVVGDSAYTSIVTDGLHRSEIERAKRHSMNEFVAGGNYCYSFRSLRMGFTALVYSYDKKNGRRVMDYNRYQIYDGLWGNAGVDFFCSLPHLRIFAEVAADAGGSVAAIAGALWSPAYSLEAAVSLRHYPRSYIATHAGAMTSTSSCSNQEGISAALRYIPSSMWSLKFNADGAYYPWDRFNVDGPSWSVKSRALALCTFDDASYVEAQVKAYVSSEDGFRPSLRIGGCYSGFNSWSLSGRVEVNPGGAASYLECGYHPAAVPLQLKGRVTVYNTRDWEHRIYVYESGPPESFGVQALYGKGAGMYLLVKYTPVKWLELCLKTTESYCAFFIRTFIPG